MELEKKNGSMVLWTKTNQIFFFVCIKIDQQLESSDYIKKPCLRFFNIFSKWTVCSATLGHDVIVRK